MYYIEIHLNIFFKEHTFSKNAKLDRYFSQIFR